jgi:hypothetical protein
MAKGPVLPASAISSKHLLAIAAALIVLVVIIYFRQESETMLVTTTTTMPPIPTVPTTQPEQTTTTTTAVALIGNLKITLDSESDSIPGGAKAHEMDFIVTGIELYNDAGEWVEIFAEQTAIGLVDNTESVTIFDGNAEAGAYEKIRLNMDGGDIWITNDLFYIYTPKRYDLVVVEQTTVDYDFEIGSEPLTLDLQFGITDSVIRIGLEYMLDPAITVTG